MRGLLSQESVSAMHERTEMIRQTIEVARKFGATDEQIVSELVERFNLSLGYARNCVETDWAESGPMVV